MGLKIFSPQSEENKKIYYLFIFTFKLRYHTTHNTARALIRYHLQDILPAVLTEERALLEMIVTQPLCFRTHTIHEKDKQSQRNKLETQLK